MSNYAKIVNANEADREKLLDEEKKRVYAEGSKAASILAYLSGYFDKEYADHYIAFEQLPLSSTLDEYRTVHHSLVATKRLEQSLKAKINAAQRIGNEGLMDDSEVNI